MRSLVDQGYDPVEHDRAEVEADRLSFQTGPAARQQSLLTVAEIRWHSRRGHGQRAEGFTKAPAELETPH